MKSYWFSFWSPRAALSAREFHAPWWESGFDFRSPRSGQREEIVNIVGVRSAGRCLRPCCGTSALWFSGEVEGSQGEALFRQGCARKLEGTVSKPKGRSYRSGPTKGWLKINCPE